MKFLTKTNTSEIYLNALTYINGGDNSELRLRLLNEQKNFCAYTEKYVVHGIDSTDVEHFDPFKKYHDDYYNYYATLRSANENKARKYNQYKNCEFFQTLFFQNETEFNSRIRYTDFVYETINEQDQDGKDFINYLGFNDDYLFSVRINHIKRLQETIGTFSPKEKLEYFKRNKIDLSYVTAIEEALNIDLSEIINS